MIRIETIVCNMLEENCYIVSDSTNECVVIDCGAYYPEERKQVVDYIRGNGLTPVHLLATHGHLDHNFGNPTLLQEFGLRPEVNAGDERLITHVAHQAAAFYGLEINEDYPLPEHLLEDMETIRFGQHELEVMATPGHSRGSVCFYCQQESVLFSGDTLFNMSVGRTDLHGGSMMQIIQSLRRLAQLPDDTTVYPGHGRTTTIGQELMHNPYMER